MFRELHKELKNLERKKRRAEMYEIEQEITILLFIIFFWLFTLCHFSHQRCN